MYSSRVRGSAQIMENTGSDDRDLPQHPEGPFRLVHIGGVLATLREHEFSLVC